MIATIEQGDGMNEYRFTRAGDTYVVTTPMADDSGWRQLDGAISVHAGGSVVCCALFGEDAKLVGDVQRAFVTWWEASYVHP